MNLANLLATQASLRPSDTALIGRRDRRTSFAELERLGAVAARTFESEGIRRGDKVVVLVPMSAELYAALLGLWRLGAVAMLVDPSADEERIAACCASVVPRAVVLTRKAHLLLARSATLRSIAVRFSTQPGIPGSRSLFASGSGASPSRPIVDLAPGDLALVTFTSGSTGQPKAAGRSHGFLLAQYAVLSRTLDLAPGQADLTTLPVFVLANLGAGVTSVIPDADLRRIGRVDPLPVLDQMHRLGVTRTVAAPAFLLRLVEECERSGRTLKCLNSIHTGGAPVFPSILRRLQAVAPHARIVAVYGSTEAEPIAEQAWAATSEADLQRTAAGNGLLAGDPVSEAYVRTVDLVWGVPAGPFTPEEFDARQTPVGVAGEIVVSGDHVLRGYLDARGDSETKFRVSDTVWHRTGDLGYRDELGRLWLLGRAGTAVGGLYPLGIEAALDGTPGLVRCALAGDREGRPVLAVQSDGTLDLSPLRERARTLGISDVRPVPEIPVDARHNSKVDYPRLAILLDRRP